MAFNARLATEFGSVVVPVVDGYEQEPAAVAAAMRGAYHDVADLGATVLAVIANRVSEPMTLPELPVPAYAIPEVPSVSAPTVAEVAAALGATLLAGDEAALGRDVLDFVVGAAHVPTLLGHLTEGALVITPGTGPTCSSPPARRTWPGRCRWPGSYSPSANNPTPG